MSIAGANAKRTDGVSNDAAPRRVLIVDDDPLIRERLHALASAAGFDCALAASGREAIEALHRDYRAIVITDRMMPDMDGLELSRALRGQAHAGYVYILMLTVRDAPEDLISGFDAGVDDYLSKSASEGELLARLYAAQRRVTLEAALFASEERYRELALTLEERITHRTVELRSLIAEFEAFSYSISHHLRTPLRSISAAAHQLLDMKTVGSTSAASKRVGQIIGSSHALGRLIDDLLSFTALRGAPVRLTRVAVGAMVAEVVKELSARSAERCIHWSMAPLPELPADAAMLRQIWIDLLDNAVKFTRGRDLALIEISADMLCDRCVFQVRDNGAGFDMDYQDKLFTVFNRLHGPHEFEGNGIGLARVRRLVELHGGKVRASGRPGAGAVFSFELPLQTRA